jgi:EpsI family protein
VQARKLLPPALAIVVLAVGIGLDARVQAARSTSVESRAIVLPAVAGWSRGGEWHGDRRPLYVDAPAEASAWYLQGEQRIGVYVANYPAQRQGSEAVYYANRPQGTATAEKVVARSRVAVSSAEDSARFGEWIVAGPASRRILWHGIRVAGRSTGDEIVAKLHQVAGALMGRNDAQVLILTAECDTDCAAARRLLFVFSEQAAATLYARAEQSAALD